MIEECEGNGPVDAMFNCIKAIVPHEAVLELYQVHAVTAGTDAQAEVSVRLSENGRSVTAKGADPDTLVASAKAYLGALNKLMVQAHARQRRGRWSSASGASTRPMWGERHRIARAMAGLRPGHARLLECDRASLSAHAGVSCISWRADHDAE